MGSKSVYVKLSLSTGEIEMIDSLVNTGVAKNRADFCRKAMNGEIRKLKEISQ